MHTRCFAIGFSSTGREKRPLAFARNNNAPEFSMPNTGGENPRQKLLDALKTLKDGSGSHKQVEFLLRSFVASNGSDREIGGPMSGVTRLTRLNEQIIQSLQEKGLYSPQLQSALPVTVGEVVDILINEAGYISPQEFEAMKTGISRRITNPSPMDLRRIASLQRAVARGNHFAQAELQEYMNGSKSSVPIPGQARKRYLSRTNGGPALYWEVYDGNALQDNQIVSIDRTAGLENMGQRGGWVRSSEFEPIAYAPRPQASEDNVVYNRGWSEADRGKYPEWMWNANYKNSPRYADDVKWAKLKRGMHNPVEQERRKSNRRAAALTGGNYDEETGSVKYAELEYAKQKSQEATEKANRYHDARLESRRIALDLNGKVFWMDPVRNVNLQALQARIGNQNAHRQGMELHVGNGPGETRAVITMAPRFLQIGGEGPQIVFTRDPQKIDQTDITNAIVRNGIKYFDVDDKHMDYIVEDKTTGTQQRFPTREEALAYAQSILASNNVSEDELTNALRGNRMTEKFVYNDTNLSANNAAEFSACRSRTLDLQQVQTMDPSAFVALGNALNFSSVSELIIDGNTLFRDPANFGALSAFASGGGMIYVEKNWPNSLNSRTVNDIIAVVGAKPLADVFPGIPDVLRDQIDTRRTELGINADEDRQVGGVGAGNELVLHVPAAYRGKVEAVFGTRSETIETREILFERDAEVIYRVSIDGEVGFARISKTDVATGNCIMTVEEVKELVTTARDRTDELSRDQVDFLGALADPTITPYWLVARNGLVRNFETVLAIKNSLSI